MVSITGGFRPEDLAKVQNLPKQILFALAAALTATAQEGQAASIAAIKETFTTRTGWFEKGNRFGIKVTRATKDNLNIMLSTRAWWLDDHEKGGLRYPVGDFIAVPTEMIRRNKRDIIPVSIRKKIFDKSSKEFFRLQTKKGPVVATRLNTVLAKQFRLVKHNPLAILAGLEPSVKIKKQSTFFEPIQRVAAARLPVIYREKLRQALTTAK